jgi:hypothetical protein
MSGLAAACEIVSASLLCAASMGALIANAPGPEKPTVEATLDPPRVTQPVRQPVHQQGTLIAVSAGSMTARSPNGYTPTNLVPLNIIVIGTGDGRPMTATPHFSVNDQVDIVGTIEDGTALATAVADSNAGCGDGPPMDYLPAQPVGADATSGR